MRPNLTVVVGGQAGSEGKGAVCGELHRLRNYTYAVRVGGPNAGHTIMDRHGDSFPLRQLPVASVADPDCQLVISAGSEVDPEVLIYEIGWLEEKGYSVKDRLTVDPEATLMHPDYGPQEQALNMRNGTTGKGIGVARSRRALRQGKRVGDDPALVPLFRQENTQKLLRSEVRGGTPVLLEGTQGYVLGSHAGHYPYCTSGDCRAVDFLAAVGFAPQPVETVVVLRTYPIRIAGNSGTLSEELTWDEVGVEPEMTTVTHKQRRVGAWDWGWAEESVEANRGSGPLWLALTHADYWWPELVGQAGLLQRKRLSSRAAAKLTELELRLGAEIKLLGTGPDSYLQIEKEGEHGQAKTVGAARDHV